MSIESDLNRIATCLEEILKTVKANSVSLGTPGKQEAIPKKSVAKPAPKEDTITCAQEAEVTTAITQEQLHQALQGYMEKNGVDGPNGVKTLMIKHGANKVKPTITSIPLANYAALLKEASV